MAIHSNETSVSRAVIDALIREGKAEWLHKEGNKLFLSYDKVEISKSETQPGMLACVLSYCGTPLVTMFVENALERGFVIVLQGMEGRMGVQLEKS